MLSHSITSACLLEFNQKLLLLQIKSGGNLSWDIPHGNVYSGETIEQAIITQIEHDTGLEIEDPELVRVYNFVTEGGVNNQFLFFKRLSDWEAMKLKMFASENVVARFFATREIELILEQGLVADPQAVTRLREYLAKPKKPFSLELILQKT
jgi:ADP-ribose pyrophosphatase YjhB (NUDIX family)